MEVSGQIHAPATLPSGKELPYTVDRASLHEVANIKNTCHCRESNPGRPARGVVTTLTELLPFPVISSLQVRNSWRASINNIWNKEWSYCIPSDYTWNLTKFMGVGLLGELPVSVGDLCKTVQSNLSDSTAFRIFCIATDYAWSNFDYTSQPQQWNEPSCQQLAALTSGSGRVDGARVSVTSATQLLHFLRYRLGFSTIIRSGRCVHQFPFRVLSFLRL
jgi:hypothetical protein